jgi:hypothetical protein
MTAEKLQDGINRCNPNSLADYARLIGLGDVLLGSLPIMRGRFSFAAAGADAGQVATLDVMKLDMGAKAATILRAWARTGGALSATGELAVQAFGATPATTQIAVAPNGDIVALTADALTDVDVLYIPIKCQAVTLTDLPVVPGTGVAVLPQWVKDRGVVYLDSFNATAGTVTGKKRVLVNGAVNPATPQCRLSVDRTQVNCTVADAVTKATITLAILPPKDIYNQLLGNTPG